MAAVYVWHVFYYLRVNYAMEIRPKRPNCWLVARQRGSLKRPLFRDGAYIIQIVFTLRDQSYSQVRGAQEGISVTILQWLLKAFPCYLPMS